MERRDYLLKQIDQLGRVLEKLLSDLTGMKQQGNMEAAPEHVAQALRMEQGLAPEDLLAIPLSDFLPVLHQEKGIGNENLERLADVLLLLAGEEPDNGKSAALYQRCLLIYTWLEQTESDYSFGRHFRIGHIRALGISIP